MNGSPELLITGLGAYTPKKVLTNKDLEKLVDTNDEWIVSRTGMKERHVSGPDEASSDLALEACREALNAAGVDAQDIDLIIVATVSPDMLFPSTACLLQAKLSAKKAVCFDVSAACSGLLYGLEVARHMMASGRYEKTLVVSADELTKYVDYTDRNTCILFGDGAAAMVIEKKSSGTGFRITDLEIESDGSQADFLKIPGGGSLLPTTPEVLAAHDHCIKMEGREVYKLAVGSMTSISQRLLEKNNYVIDDIDWLVPHQANKRIIEAVGRKIKVNPDRVFLNLEKYGNTSGAAVGIAFTELLATGEINDGAKLLLITFGAGFTTAGCLLQYQEA